MPMIDLTFISYQTHKTLRNLKAIFVINWWIFWLDFITELLETINSSCSPVNNYMPDNYGDCKFYKDGNLTVFETPSPYLVNMQCTQNVTCSNPNHTVQYEFEYFETESGYDELYVNGLVYQGNNVPTYEWIDSFSSKVYLLFYSDSIITKEGFKMNLKCDFSTPPETTADVPTTSYSEECIFEDFGNSAIFDTGSPYRNNMRHGFSVPIH